MGWKWGNLKVTLNSLSFSLSHDQTINKAHELVLPSKYIHNPTTSHHHTACILGQATSPFGLNYGRSVPICILASNLAPPQPTFNTVIEKNKVILLNTVLIMSLSCSKPQWLPFSFRIKTGLYTGEYCHRWSVSNPPISSLTSFPVTTPQRHSDVPAITGFFAVLQTTIHVPASAPWHLFSPFLKLSLPR